MKAVIFDSGTLINLSMNGLLGILESLKKKLDVRFIITKAVKYEVIDRPIGIMRFELGALRIQKLLSEKTLEMPSALGVDEDLISKEGKKLEDLANHFIQVRGRWVQLVSEAEVSCLALSDQLSKKGVQNLIAIDERTTRTLCEHPEGLERIMSEKLHQRVELATENINLFSKYKFIRSSELIYVAYKKGLIDLQGEKALEALLYATKFSGSAISFEEINILKKL